MRPGTYPSVDDVPTPLLRRTLHHYPYARAPARSDLERTTTMTTYRRTGPTPDDLYLRHEQRQRRCAAVLLRLAFQGRRPFQSGRAEAEAFAAASRPTDPDPPPPPPERHRYVAERSGWRTCRLCGQGANASVHRNA